MTDTTTRLNNLKTQIDEGKAQKAKAEANLETYTKQLNDIKAEIRTLGVEPAEEALAADLAPFGGAFYSDHRLSLDGGDAGPGVI